MNYPEESEPRRSEEKSEPQMPQQDRTVQPEPEMRQQVEPKFGYSQFINNAKYDPFPEQDDKIEDLDEDTITDVNALRMMINYFRNRYYWNQEQLEKLEHCEPNVINHIDVDITGLPKDWKSNYIPITVRMRPVRTESLEDGHIMAIEVSLDEDQI